MDYGWLSLLPPLIAIVAAFVTRKIILSLAVGVVIGTLITSNGHPIPALTKGGEIFWRQTEFSNFASLQKFNESWNLFIILFCCILGTIINLLNQAGGAYAYGKWALTKIKSRVSASLATMFFGFLIFFDDYFNCLTVGTVMKPVTDKFKISRAKLAYIIDSTTAPVCILAPVSSWVIYVVDLLGKSGIEKDMSYGVFLQSILFNSYAWLTLLMVFILCVSQKDFGPMKKYEQKAIETGDIGAFATTENSQVSENGRIFDLVLPLGIMIFSIIGLMLYTGKCWIFGGENSVIAAFQNMHAAKSMFWGGFGSLLFTIFYCILRSLISPKEIGHTIVKSVRIMLPVTLTLILAWSLGEVIKKEVYTGKYIAKFLSGGTIAYFLPAIIFAISSITAFATGSSWGTFAIMIPITVPLAFEVASALLVPMIGAVLAGAIYGDHTSPISDTTILSSVGAECKHMDHVATQAPYSSLVAIICFLGFIMTGFTISLGQVSSALLTLIVTAIVLVICIFRLGKTSLDSKLK